MKTPNELKQEYENGRTHGFVEGSEKLKAELKEKIEGLIPDRQQNDYWSAYIDGLLKALEIINNS